MSFGVLTIIYNYQIHKPTKMLIIKFLLTKKIYSNLNSFEGAMLNIHILLRFSIQKIGTWYKSHKLRKQYEKTH